jgi:hypothetical protein
MNCLGKKYLDSSWGRKEKGKNVCRTCNTILSSGYKKRFHSKKAINVLNMLAE